MKTQPLPMEAAGEFFIIGGAVSHDNGENTDDDGPKTIGRAGVYCSFGSRQSHDLQVVASNPFAYCKCSFHFQCWQYFWKNQYNKGEDTQAQGLIGGLCSTTDIQIGHWVNVTMDVPPFRVKIASGELSNFDAFSLTN